jgi:hypothetical protein
MWIFFSEHINFGMTGEPRHIGSSYIGFISGLVNIECPVTIREKGRHSVQWLSKR